MGGRTGIVGTAGRVPRKQEGNGGHRSLGTAWGHGKVWWLDMYPWGESPALLRAMGTARRVEWGHPILGMWLDEEHAAGSREWLRGASMGQCSGASKTKSLVVVGTTGRVSRLLVP